MADASDPLATQTRASARRPAAARAARLRAVHPPELPWTLALDTEACTIGRTGVDGTPALPHSTVSRQHLRVQWDAARGTHVVTDLGSHNGTRVDAHDIGREPRALHDTAVVMPGDVCLVYEVGVPGRDRGAEVAIVGDSPAVADLREAVLRAAADPSPVLITGETGSGKEYVARELHRLSPRHAGPFVAINCAALSPELVESQLFGHTRGAFTGAVSDQRGVFRAADAGTLLLDEVGELPPPLQPKLLRALQEGEVQPVGSTQVVRVDVRVVAATNVPLAEAIERGTFRRDLYARLALWEIAVPRLAARRGDILHWLDELRRAWHTQRARADRPWALDAQTAEAILCHDWPANLRELDRLVHELARHDDAPTIEPFMLPEWIGRDPTPRLDGETPTRPPVPSAEEFTAEYQRLDGNVRALARHYRRDRRQIYRWITAHGLADPT